MAGDIRSLGFLARLTMLRRFFRAICNLRYTNALTHGASGFHGDFNRPRRYCIYFLFRRVTGVESHSGHVFHYFWCTPRDFSLHMSETQTDQSHWEVPKTEIVFWDGRQNTHCLVIPVINEGDRIRNLL